MPGLDQQPSARSPTAAASARVLMLAPEPSFEPRGTPFSEYHRIKALCELGYRVDLVTYPFGRDVRIPGLEIFRCPRPPFVRGVRIGPSAVKLLLDALLAVTASRLARARRYDAVHSHEEAGLLGVWLAKRLGVPHLYDMHSSLPQQLGNFGYTRSGLVRRLFERVETTMIARSRVVITICQELQDTAAALGAGDRATLIENVMGGDVDGGASVPPAELRARYGLRPEQPVVLYTGTFEAYQGLDPLTDAAALLGATHPDARVLVVGGAPEQVEAARRRAAAAGSPLVFAGQRPAHEIPAFVNACDVLVSPRTSGTNTPLKIYSYLRSGTADRGDRPANAHPGARREHGPARAARRGRAGRRPGPAARPPGGTRAAGRGGPGARRRALQPRVVSRPDGRGLRAASRAVGVPVAARIRPRPDGSAVARARVRRRASPPVQASPAAGRHVSTRPRGGAMMEA